MATAAEREKARRLEVERAFIKPKPIHDWADAAPTDRPSRTIDNIIAAARAKGWIVEEKTRYDWHLPTWVTDPDGGPARYECKHRTQYHLLARAGEVDHAVRPGQLVYVDLLLIDGRKTWLKLARLGNNYAQLSQLALTGVAKLIREEGIQA